MATTCGHRKSHLRCTWRGRIPLVALAWLAVACGADDCAEVGPATLVVAEISGWPKASNTKERVEVVVFAKARPGLSVDSVSGQTLAVCDATDGTVNCVPGVFQTSRTSGASVTRSLRVAVHFAPHELYETIGVRIVPAVDGVNGAAAEVVQTVTVRACQTGEPGVAPFRFSL